MKKIVLLLVLLSSVSGTFAPDWLTVRKRRKSAHKGSAHKGSVPLCLGNMH